MQNLLLFINATFVKKIKNYDNRHYSKIKTYQGVTQSHLTSHCSEPSVSQRLFSTKVRACIIRPHLVLFPLHLQAAQRGTGNLAREQLHGHLLATRNLYTIVEVLVMEAPSKILVPNVWNPSSN